MKEGNNMKETIFKIQTSEKEFSFDPSVDSLHDVVQTIMNAKSHYSYGYYNLSIYNQNKLCRNFNASAVDSLSVGAKLQGFIKEYKYALANPRSITVYLTCLTANIFEKEVILLDEPFPENIQLVSTFDKLMDQNLPVTLTCIISLENGVSSLFVLEKKKTDFNLYQELNQLYIALDTLLMDSPFKGTSLEEIYAGKKLVLYALIVDGNILEIHYVDTNSSLTRSLIRLNRLSYLYDNKTSKFTEAYIQLDDGTKLFSIKDPIAEIPSKATLVFPDKPPVELSYYHILRFLRSNGTPRHYKPFIYDEFNRICDVRRVK